MKALFIALSIAGVLAMAGCSDSGGNVNVGNNGNNGGGNANNLQTFVVNNCNKTPSGAPANINGASFPPNTQTDPTQSVYTRNCLNK